MPPRTDDGNGRIVKSRREKRDPSLEKNTTRNDQHGERIQQRPRLQRPTNIELPAVYFEYRRGEPARENEHELRIRRAIAPMMTENAKRLRRERVNARIRDLNFDRINGEHQVTRQIEE